MTNTNKPVLTAVYTYPQNGFKPALGLQQNHKYMVESVDMGSSYTDVYLAGFGRPFNSVYFEFFEDEKPVDIYRHPAYNPYRRGSNVYCR